MPSSQKCARVCICVVGKQENSEEPASAQTAEQQREPGRGALYKSGLKLLDSRFLILDSEFRLEEVTEMARSGGKKPK